MTKPRDIQPDDAYLDKLSKLLPAELTATYFVIRSFAANNLDLTWVLAVFALVLSIVFYFIAPKLLKFTDARARLLYCVTFIIWAAAIDPQRFADNLMKLNESLTDTVVFSIMATAAIWSFAVPYLVESDAP